MLENSAAGRDCQHTYVEKESYHASPMINCNMPIFMYKYVYARVAVHAHDRIFVGGNYLG